MRVWGRPMAGVTSLICFGVAGLVGCGGDDDGPGASCGKVQACGGDVVGDWEVVAGCVDGTRSPATSRCR